MSTKQPVDNYRLPQYDVEVETQENGQRQVVKVGEIAEGSNTIGKVDIADTSIKQDSEQFAKMLCVMEQLLVEVKIMRSAIGHIMDEHLKEDDIEED